MVVPASTGPDRARGLPPTLLQSPQQLTTTSHGSNPQPSPQTAPGLRPPDISYPQTPAALQITESRTTSSARRARLKHSIQPFDKTSFCGQHTSTGNAAGQIQNRRPSNEARIAAVEQRLSMKGLPLPHACTRTIWPQRSKKPDSTQAQARNAQKTANRAISGHISAISAFGGYIQRKKGGLRGLPNLATLITKERYERDRTATNGAHLPSAPHLSRPPPGNHDSPNSR